MKGAMECHGGQEIEKKTGVGRKQVRTTQRMGLNGGERLHGWQTQIRTRGPQQAAGCVERVCACRGRCDEAGRTDVATRMTVRDQKVCAADLGREGANHESAIMQDADNKGKKLRGMANVIKTSRSARQKARKRGSTECRAVRCRNVMRLENLGGRRTR